MPESRRLVRAGVRRAAVRLGEAGDEPDGTSPIQRAGVAPLFFQGVIWVVPWSMMLHPKAG